MQRSLQDGSSRVRIAAAEALLKMGNRDGIPCLLEMLQSMSAQLRSRDYKNIVEILHAITALAYAEGASAIPYLKFLAKDTQASWAVRLNALRCLARLFGWDPRVLEEIVAMQKDPEGQVRAEAIEITRRLKPDHRSVSLEVRGNSIRIWDAKRGQVAKATLQIIDKPSHPNRPGCLQIASIASTSGSKVRLVGAKPFKGGLYPYPLSRQKIVEFKIDSPPIVTAVG
ncbi:MAG: hypothetical protein QHH07_12570, partial [Sedimentisphaerales bacterium]|nr:hypothetical protein [Sedimentisphaerales bacterium]